MEYIVGASIISTFGYDFIIRSLQKSIESVSNINFLINNIHSTTKCDEIKDMDLDFLCKTVSDTIQYCVHKYSNNKINDEKHILINNVINSIQNNLLVIENNLLIIKNTLEYNNSLWLPYLYAKSFNHNIQILIKEKNILDNRLELFLKIINI